MPSTRSKGAAAAAAPSPVAAPASLASPSMLFVLPRAATPAARIVSLPHPRHGRPARYLVCPAAGICELTRIAAPAAAPRSWLVETRAGPAPETPEPVAAVAVASADLYVATPMDPLFLVLPALVACAADKRHLFLAADDHLDQLPHEASHLAEVLRCAATRALVERRMAAVCDAVEAGNEPMLRLSEDKLWAVLLAKARRMSAAGLPASMHEKLVKKPLEAPLVVQRRQPPPAAAPPLADAPAAAAACDDAIVSAAEATPQVLALQALRVAFDYICASYVAAPLATRMRARLLDGASVDFAPLDAHLANVAALRSEAFAARATDFSHKRGRDDEADAAREDKKRKLDEDKRAKASESRGVRELKKVNTSGMKKLSHFFKAK